MLIRNMQDSTILEFIFTLACEADGEFKDHNVVLLEIVHNVFCGVGVEDPDGPCV